MEASRADARGGVWGGDDFGEDVFNDPGGRERSDGQQRGWAKPGWSREFEIGPEDGTVACWAGVGMDGRVKDSLG